MHSLSQQPTTPAIFIDPNLRLPPVPTPAQNQPVHSPIQQQQQQQQQGVPSHVQVAQAAQAHVQAQQAMNTGRPADGLGLLIEAFDTHQTAGALGTPTGQQPGPQPYDPHAPPHGYYHPSTLGPDGYENQLAYYIEDSIPPQGTGIQNWAINGMGTIPGAGIYPY